MLEVALAVGVVEDPELDRALAEVERRQRRADDSFALAAGAFFASLMFVGFVGWLV